MHTTRKATQQYNRNSNNQRKREREEKSSNEMIINGLTRLPRLDDNIESVCN